MFTLITRTRRRRRRRKASEEKHERRVDIFDYIMSHSTTNIIIYTYICVVSHIIRAAAYPYVTPHISWIVEFPVRSRHVMPCHTSLNPVQVSCNFMSCQKVPAGVVTILHHTMGCGTPSWFCRSCWTYMIPIYSYIESLNIRATQTQTHQWPLRRAVWLHGLWAYNHHRFHLKMPAQ